jgi:hypothetical protein
LALFDGLNGTYPDSEDKYDHLDLLDNAIGSGGFYVPQETVLDDKFSLGRLLRPVLLQAVVPEIWRLDELRWPVLM